MALATIPSAAPTTVTPEYLNDVLGQIGAIRDEINIKTNAIPAAIAPHARPGKDIKTHDHIGFIRWLGRTIALPTMVLFSVGALVQLTKGALGGLLGAIFTLVFSGFTNASGFAKLDGTATTTTVFAFFLVLGFDIIMIVKADDLMSKVQQGLPFKEYRIEALLVGFVASVETITYSMLLYNQEHPKGFFDWILIIARGASAPVVSVVLATMKDKIMTEAEMMHNLSMQVANAIAGCLQEIKAEAKLEYLPILWPFYHTLKGTWNDQKKGEVKDIITQIENMMPDAMKTKYQAEINALKADLDATTARLSEDIQRAEARHSEELDRIKENAEATLRREREDLMKNILPMLVSVINTREWPQEFLAIRPEFSQISVDQILKSAGVKSGAIGAKATPQTVSQNISEALVSIGCDPTKHFAKSSTERKGLWVKSSAIPIISDGKIKDDKATELAALLSGGKKEGRSNVVKATTLLRELAGRNQLASSLVSLVNGLANTEASEGDPAAMSAIQA